MDVDSLVGTVFSGLSAVEPCAGDVPATSADLTVASALLGYQPCTDLHTGMARQAEWL